MRRYHVGPLLLFAGLSLLWTFPLVLHMGTHVPGDPGDNYSILWNLWWARRALTSSDLSFFHTPYLFAPFGADLVNHPHTALQGFFAATVLARVDLVPALNLVILLSVFANFACAYWLTYDIARHRRAATLGAVIFGASPYVSAHLLGHFDLISVWVLPLFGLCLRRALTTGGIRWMIACGVALALAAYSAYYYVVYLGLMAGAYVIGHLSLAHFRLQARLQTTRTRTIRRAGASLLLLDAALIVWISATDGSTWTILGRPVSIHSVQNPLTLGWALLGGVMLTMWRVPLRLRVPAPEPSWVAARTAAWSALTFAACASPLLYQAAALAAAGRYVTQSYVWRNAMPGIDPAALFLGNSFHPLLRTAAVFEQPWFNHVEGVAWVGVVPLILLLWPRRGRSVPSPDVRPWHAVLFIAFIWALGPRLVVAGFDVDLPLPQILVRFIPLVNNARVPGRAMVLVYLAVAVLVAIRVTRLEGIWRRAVTQWALLGLVLLDFLPAPMPLTRLSQPAVYATLARLSDGEAVCEVPFGFGDGMGDTGSPARDILYYATLHEHPLVGGSIGRKPPDVAAAYSNIPILDTLLRFASGSAASAIANGTSRPPALGESSAPLPCRYVVIDRATASSESVDYLQRTLPLALLAADSGRELYRVERPE